MSISQVDLNMRMQYNSEKIKTELFDNYIQTSSNISVRKFSDFSSASSGVAFLTTSSELNSLLDFSKGNVELLSRMRIQEEIVKEIQDTATVVKSAITELNSSSFKSMHFDEFAKNQLGLIQDLLNKKHLGKSIFSGTNGFVTPVVNLKEKSNIVNGSVTSNYYQGNGEKAYAYIDHDVSISYGVNADDPAFQNLIAALNYGVAALQDDSLDQSTHKLASDSIDTAINSLISMVTNLGNQINIIENVQRMNDSLKIFFNDRINEEIGVDLTDLLTKSQQLSANLTASYQVYIKFIGLSLANYM